ncbi:MAG: DUF3108 domain-containing protein [Bacteroidaceae bacterium]|nr:DUF3108 domain-containing protein [Bacteroidaceae bacterium]
MKYLTCTAILLALAFSGSERTLAQCATENTAFNAGEELSYSLFFNWKFIWLSAGTATMDVVQTKWEGKPAYKGHLITRTSERLDRFFMMRDTIKCIVAEDMTPLYYKKGANEGGRYYVDEVWYSYQDGSTHLRQRYQNREGIVTERTYDSPKCIFDMMSMLLRARSFQVENIRKGEKMHFPMADGHKVEDITLIYRGRENFKMKSTGITYRCLVFSLVEYPAGKEKEVITFYITDDENHIPVRLDLFLRFGVAKAYLSKSKGLRHECTSIVK